MRANKEVDRAVSVPLLQESPDRGFKLEFSALRGPAPGRHRRHLFLLHDPGSEALLLAQHARAQLRQLATSCDPCRLAISGMYAICLRHSRQEQLHHLGDWRLA